MNGPAYKAGSENYAYKIKGAAIAQDFAEQIVSVSSSGAGRQISQYGLTTEMTGLGCLHIDDMGAD